MNYERLQHFFLVGGTALSLQIGDRISIDLDLFTTDPFDKDDLLIYLECGYKFNLNYQSKNTLKSSIQDVKADFIIRGYPLVYPLIFEGAIRMAGPADITAMKVNPISGMARV